jgi:hypothetical protein
VIRERGDVISKRVDVISERSGSISVHDVHESVKAVV